MSQLYHRANLASDDIPLLSSFMGQTVIMGKFDQDFELSVNQNNTQRLQKEKQTPQAYYAHNVLPTGKGYQSIGYTQKIPGLAGKIDFKGMYLLRDIDENKTWFSPGGGKNYFWDRNTNAWASINPFVGRENSLVTVAYLNGETYIFYEKVGCYKYTKATKTMDAVALTGLTVAQVNGICASNGFLIAWDDTNTVYRSQSASPLDFTPDPALGSGSGIPEDIKGKIVVVLPIVNGYIVYTTANAVAATFQQNIRYPFIYREVAGSSGVQSPNHVTWLDNFGDHFVWTKAGLQRLNKSQSIPFYPEITDFLVAKVFEDYNEATDIFTVTRLTSQLTVKLTLIGSRFLIISYGVNPGTFTHAIVYDIALKRFGKLKITHVDCFNYAVANLSGALSWRDLGTLSWRDLGATTWRELGSTGVETAETPKEMVGFIMDDGTVSIIDFDLAHTSDSGVLVMGKYQFTRDRTIVLDGIDFENADTDANFQLVVLSSLNGKTISRITYPYLAVNSGYLRRFNSDVVAVNHSLVAKGTFNLVSLEILFHAHGRM